LIAGFAAYLAFAPVPFAPQAWTPPPNPGQTDAFAPNEALKAATVALTGGKGPEDVAFDGRGYLYSGLEDGRIVRVRPDGSTRPETFANTGGRPLGLQFDGSGNLIVADAVRGLLSVALDGKVRVLTDQAAGGRMIFVDDLDIGADGVIWFSDASTRFPIEKNMLEVFEGSATGRLLTYDPATGKTEVRISGLRFANGVALGPGGDYVLVNETLGYRVKRFWIKGPKAGTSDIFIESLPGFPDNIAFDGKDTFWIALVFPRQDMLDSLASRPFLRRMLYTFTAATGLGDPTPSAFGWVIGVGLDGTVKANLQDPSGRIHTITSVNRFGDILALGSLTMDGIATLPVP
jgi:sugar lactone lactonase YvrE